MSETYRAALLTSLTTVAGLLPLLSEKSLQAQILIPLATSIVFGLIASTCWCCGHPRALRDPGRFRADREGGTGAGSVTCTVRAPAVD